MSLVGDTNEHAESVCRVAASTGMVASNGASHSGRCDTGSGPIKVDWVMGTAGTVDFSRRRV